MMEDLNLAQVRAFVTVVDSGGFTSAATQLGRTQSAISAKIRQLEENLGVTLLERTTRSVNLSRMGRSFLVKARDLLEQAEHLRSDLAVHASIEPIRIGVAEHFIGPKLLYALAELEVSNPDIPLDMSVELTDNLLGQLDRGALDVVVASHRPERSDAQVIHQESCFWAAAHDYDISLKRPVQLIAMPPECHYRQMATDALDAAGIDWRLRFTTSSIASAQAATMAGLGISIVGQSALLDTLKVLGPRQGFPSLPTSAMSLFSSRHQAADPAIAKVISALTLSDAHPLQYN